MPSKALADAIGGKVAPLDPLAGNVVDNLKNMAETIRSAFAGEVKK